MIVEAPHLTEQLGHDHELDAILNAHVQYDNYIFIEIWIFGSVGPVKQLIKL